MAEVIEFPTINHEQAWQLFKEHILWLSMVQGFSLHEFMLLSPEERLEWLYTWNADAAEKLRVYLHAVKQ